MPFERTSTSSPDEIPRRLASSRGELDLGVGPLEAELRDALDGRAGEERPVALEREEVPVAAA